MPKFKFEKLVRDKIVDRQLESGARPVFRELDETEHKRALIAKITEEALEIAGAAPEELAGEIADVQQALDDLKKLCGISDEAVQRAQDKKTQRNGAFTCGLYIEYVEVDEGDEWAQYYRDNADRYPEID
jgi:predicted house-cleaning noncanonical NTP pyrophosphatase (MazG superfamily)